MPSWAFVAWHLTAAAVWAADPSYRYFEGRDTSGHPVVLGYSEDLPREYSAQDVLKSAAEWDPFNAGSNFFTLKLTKTSNCLEDSSVNTNGAWCLDTQNRKHVNLANDQSYYVPPFHVPADDIIAKVLLDMLGRDGSSLNDFGAGVGQYGHYLLSQDPTIRYRGYDGASNVESVTNGFVQWFDLTVPLSLPVADWVISLEVGEHIPHKDEMNYVRNLHAHSCRGIIISWGNVLQGGHGHINNHRWSYIRDLFVELDYELDRELSDRMQAIDIRKARSSDGTATHHLRSQGENQDYMHAYPWLWKTVVFRRREPRTDGPCAP
jgi:hypothetical protein